MASLHEGELIAGAVGQPHTDKFWDDEQEVQPGAATPEATTVVVSAGQNSYLESVAQGDDTYQNDAQGRPIAISAGPNKMCDTSTTGVDQLWAKFLVETDGSSTGGLQLAVLYGLLCLDASNGTSLFQAMVRAARE